MDFWTYAVMLGMLILLYVQFVIMLIELQKVLSQELKCLCGKTTTVLSESTVPKTMDVSFLLFYCIRLIKYIVYKCIYTLYTVDIIIYRSLCPLLYSHTL
jgi:hypothetical protein